MQLSKNFTLWDLCSCTSTYRRYAATINPFPENPESIEALENISQLILDPIQEAIAPIRITYGFSSKNLIKYLNKKDPVTGIKNGRICPKIDQHASYELNCSGNYICKHQGAAVDIIANLSSSALVQWIMDKQLPYDSIYYYGDRRPLHVSWSVTPRKKIWRFSDRGTPKPY
ncbi:hypothetical protein [Rivularia sp. UHCC 0363]|uniref:hypothetical protein n=1 Tax=Rivularia sp. UHCC 0363 TaxID=3110244 RepID=UPI002B205BEE|nr:hypothetical protein [Rivularia sp. UHCC 0363]MEA5595681.1 hypothetical protein [Rivularia sp. UHCC 0363]